MKISEFTYAGVQLRYSPETGECWREFSSGRWRLITPGNNAVYTQLGICGRLFYLHRIIAEIFLNAGKPLTAQQEVDHIRQADGSHYQDRLSNLRICSRSENNWNRKLSLNNTSGYKGVCWHKLMGKWHARINISGRKQHIGYFTTPEAAALAYDNAAKKLHGEFAKLNFN